MSHEKIEALLTLLSESESLEPESWNTAQLEFEVSLSQCPTITELESFTEIGDRIGADVYEDPFTARIGSHLDGCHPCRVRARALSQNPSLPRSATTDERRPAPVLWRTAASLLGVGFLVWLAVGPSAPTTNPRTTDTRDVLSEGTFVAKIEGVDIAPLEPEYNERGQLVQAFEISVRPEVDIQVSHRGWSGECNCNRWEPCSYTFSAQTDALTYYRVEIVLSQESESNRFLRVVAKADLAPDTLDESARCCWEDAVNPASCLPDGCMIASTAF